MTNLSRLIPASVITILFVLAFDANAQASNSPFSRDEIRALRSLRTLHGAQMTYAATTGIGSFGTLAQLGDAQLIDSALASGIRYGYAFRVVFTPATPTTAAEFYVTATPRKYPSYGRYSFFVNTTGMIRGADKRGQPADANDPSLIVDLCSSGSIADNERCTIESLRTLHGAEMTYAATSGNGNFTGLTELGRVNLVHPALATGMTHGYSFAVVVYPRSNNAPTEFRIIAVPQIYGVTGVKSFYIGTAGVITGADKNGRPADETDPPINN